jgi:hypothetical protein
MISFNPTTNYSRMSLGDKIDCVIVRCINFGFELDEEFFTDEWCELAVKSFNSATVLQVFGLAQILAENQPIPVRGAMYRGVGSLWRDTSDPNYSKCNGLILKMRRLGLIPYAWITDGTRISDKPSSWSGLADFADTVAQAYRKDLWERQPHYIEVFCEKDAMSGVIRPVTQEFDIQLNPIRGFASETFLWSIAEEWKEIEKPIYVYYLGDHDPSGFKIEADLKRRLEMFCGFSLHWERLAITIEDFESNLLGFPVKRNPKKIKTWRPYLERYGDRCVEVDALPATVVRDRVRAAIESHINAREWRLLKDQEARERIDVLDMVRSLNNGGR